MLKKSNLLWVLPIFLIISIFTLLPLLISIIDTLVIEGKISLDSFRKIFSDKLFITAYVNSLVYAFVSLISVALSIYASLAIIGVSNKYLRNSFSSIIFLQYVFLGLAISSGYVFMFKTDYGLVNMFLGIFSIDNISFLVDPGLSMVTVSFISIITSLPFLITSFTFRGLSYISTKEELILTNGIELDDWILKKAMLKNMTRFIFLTTYFVLIQGFLCYPIGLYSGDLNSIFVAQSQSLVCYINRSINLGSYSNASACSIVCILTIIFLTATFYGSYLIGRNYV